MQSVIIKNSQNVHNMISHNYLCASRRSVYERAEIILHLHRRSNEAIQGIHQPSVLSIQRVDVC